MKRCPTCDKTFEDSMRFCQADGTPLVEDAPPLDPYATMVASSDEIKAASKADDAPVPISEPENVLDLPAADGGDMMKTMVASADEMRKILEEKDDPGMEIPERPATPVPEPPKFSEPEISPPQFGGQSTPFNEISPPPTSPYEVKRPSMNLQGEEADDPDSAVTMIQPLPESMPTPPPSPFQQASAPPPAASSPQKFEPPTTPAPIGSAASPVAPNAAAGQSKMLAWVSVILGVLGLTICCGAIIPSVIAIITGFIARSKAAKDPAHYGGIPLAMTGIVTGLLGVVIGVVWLIFLFFFNGLQALSRAY